MFLFYFFQKIGDVISALSLDGGDGSGISALIPTVRSFTQSLQHSICRRDSIPIKLITTDSDRASMFTAFLLYVERSIMSDMLFRLEYLGTTNSAFLMGYIDKVGKSIDAVSGLKGMSA